MGTKAADYRIAALCSECHHAIDQGSHLQKWERHERWETAHRTTIGWLFESGCLSVKEPE